MGEMMVNIKSYFMKNGLFYGYTGTPLFDENKVTGMVNEKSEVIDTTEKLFGPELHKYTIDQAIADGNVLGFNVDYINTGEFTNYDDLREQIKAKMENEKPDMSELEMERLIYGWSDLEVEKEAARRKILYYRDETHIPRVVELILDNWEEQSKGRKFNAILTVAYKKRAIAFFKEFKKQFRERDDNINLALTFSFGGESETDKVDPETIEMMFRDYASFTGIEFVCGDKAKGEEAYFGDIVSRGTRGGSGRNRRNIDLIIVADQLLTGYDSKFLNTLYVDRPLAMQGLIQAYSRTNRIYGKDREFGSIVNFQYPKITEEQVNTALMLYGSGGASSRAIVEDYDTAVEKLSIKVGEMIASLDDPGQWESLETDKAARELFTLSFVDASKQLGTVMQYYEYEWNDERFKIDEHAWLKYTGAYKNLTSNETDTPVEPVVPLSGKTKITMRQVIDDQHILSLIGSRIKNDKGIQTVDDETLRLIYEEIQELSDMGQAKQAKLLKEFVETELITGHLKYDLDFDQTFENWKKEKVQTEAERFAEEWGLYSNVLLKSLDQYSTVKEDSIPYIDEIQSSVDYEKAENKEAGSQLPHMMKLINKTLPKWLKDMKKQYD
ncbi:MAG TPA: type I restriction endonuclease subunit R, partial [Clostridia bacterium]|nr:type I restriction endonuclease subunit R [Clostridia bacterium]